MQRLDTCGNKYNNCRLVASVTELYMYTVRYNMVFSHTCWLQEEMEAKNTQLQQKDNQLWQKDQQLLQKDIQLQDKDRQLQDKDRQLQEKDRQLKEKDEELLPRVIALKVKNGRNIYCIVLKTNRSLISGISGIFNLLRIYFNENF